MCELNSNYYLYDYFYDSSDANEQMTYYDWSIYIINSLNLYVTQEAKALALQKEQKRNKDKGILTTHITT